MAAMQARKDPEGTPAARLRLASWNVNSLLVRMPRVLDWLEKVEPDVLCLQETKLSDAAFPHAELESVGYGSVAHGDGGYNGVAILSRVGIEDVSRGFAGEPGFPDPERRAIGATCGGLRVWSIYTPNGRTLEDPHYAYKLAWLRALRDAMREEMAGGVPLALCGDFNVAPSDADVWDPAEFVGSTHVTPEERRAIAELVELGLRDLQPRALKGAPFTYWDYRAGMFHRGCGMRIDLLLIDADLAAGITDVYIDRDARKGSKPSDHAPVLADLTVAPSAR
jgi:exodeoxyribonuclease-3